MDIWENYIKRYQQIHVECEIPADNKIEFCIVIPSYNEPDLFNCLDSISQCIAIDAQVEVIVVLNQSENADEKINELHLNQWKTLNVYHFKNKVRLIPLWLKKIPIKKAGVGYARKAGMDLAAQRLIKSGNNNGLIICLDADCLVSKNYLQAIFDASEKNPNVISFAFEHRLDDISEKQINGIINYELFLHYYYLGLLYCGYPYAGFTIGSAMGANVLVYLKHGGMNQRKAGEDFYFMNKLLPLGNHLHIKLAKVYPSSRVSERVPFGTGRAMQNWLNQEINPAHTYKLESFLHIKKIIDLGLWCLKHETDSIDLALFPNETNQIISAAFFEHKIRETKSNTANYQAAEKRFFQWFDAFLIMKLLNMLRDEVHGKGQVKDQLNKLLQKSDISHLQSELELLDYLRNSDVY